MKRVFLALVPFVLSLHAQEKHPPLHRLTLDEYASTLAHWRKTCPKAAALETRGMSGRNMPVFLLNITDPAVKNTAKQVWLVDCFNRGRLMLAGDVAKHHPAANPGMEDLIHEAATADATLLRILRNLDDAYERLGLMPERQFMRRLAVKLMEN